MSRAERLRRLCKSLAERMGVEPAWQLDMAAQLSQVAAVTLTATVAEKLHLGQALSADEQAAVDRLPALTERLLEPIPRLEDVRAVLAGASVAAAPLPQGAPAQAVLASLLRLAMEFDGYCTRGLSPSQAVDTLRARETYADAWLVALAKVSGASNLRQAVREVLVKDLAPGMIVMQDVRLRGGMLLVARGFEVTESFIERLNNYTDGQVMEQLLVADMD